MFEKRNQPLISTEEFLSRLFRHIGIALIIVFCSLLIGVLGYHYLEGLTWIDSMLNAAMILGGMGTVNLLNTEVGKIFASFYTLYSGIIFLVIAGIIFAPIFHRFLHRF